MRGYVLRGLVVGSVLCSVAGHAWAEKATKPKKAVPAAAPPVPVPAPGPKPLSETLSGDAKVDYEAARLLYGDGDHAGALVKFQSAFDQSKDPRLLWNMAACEKNLRHYAKVMGLVNRYLKEGGASLTEQDWSDAKDLLGAIESFTAALTVVVNEPGAEVSVDDDVIGTSPLAAPTVVDLGMRRIKVKKEGFREVSVSVPIGGSKEVTQTIALEREVHEGKLEVRSAPDATISIDGKELGRGVFTGTLASGGHTLRIVAPGMRPYQTEVVISDNESRNVDVALEAIPVAAPPPETHGALNGMELGLRSGYGREYLHAGQDPGFIPLWLDIGYRVGVPTLLGIYLQGGWIDRSATCGIEGRHGPSPTSPTDDAVRYAYESCTFIKAGAQMIFHTLPRTIVDPWFGFDVGIHASFDKFRSYDPVTATYAEGHDNNASVQPSFQLGVDTHPVRALGLGIFMQAGLEFGGEGKASNNDSGPCGGPGQVPCNNDSGDSGPAAHWLFGLRAAYTFQ